MDSSYSNRPSDGNPSFPAEAAQNLYSSKGVRSFNGWHSSSSSSSRPKGRVPTSSTSSSLNPRGPQILQPTKLNSEPNSDDKPAENHMTASDPSWRNGSPGGETTQRRGTSHEHSDDHLRSAELASLQEMVGWQHGEMEAMKRAIEDMQGLLARQRREERDLSWQLREHRAVSHGRAALVRDWREHARGICVAYRSTIRRQAAEISLLRAELARGKGQVERRESAPLGECGDGCGKLSDA
ncbi:hypothetical protein PpBr36_06952 [Pyricularia pennisetigena]|uniref:hypothetical protein n=1 Tax=Pyricularia pennisetigena TaxID=1578925 RepID=UPI001151B68E|nr:hypothetical protein PpBr36_06952 [Pyricularia pennisetigena]TLS25323.1 hypothetical protein PpBr36_06952 [Pyricularia pennisetigena]